MILLAVGMAALALWAARESAWLLAGLAVVATLLLAGLARWEAEERARDEEYWDR